MLVKDGVGESLQDREIKGPGGDTLVDAGEDDDDMVRNSSGSPEKTGVGGSPRRPKRRSMAFELPDIAPAPAPFGAAFDFPAPAPATFSFGAGFGFGSFHYK